MAELVVLDGFHAVKHALRFGARLTELVAVDRGAVEALADALAPDLLPALRARCIQDPARFRELSRHPTGVVALAHRPVADIGPLSRAGRGAPLVLLDEPRHPGNLGAVVRVAAAAGASGVAVRGDLDPWSPAAVRGGAGLQYAVPVLTVCDLAQVEPPLVALDPAGDPLTPADLADDAVLAFGTEREGLPDDLLARADRVRRLPMRPGVSSLNLATAASAVLYLWRFGSG